MGTIQLFDVTNQKIYRLVPDHAVPTSHSFGGSLQRRGYVVNRPEIQLHLVLEVDQNQLPFTPWVDSIQRLPLLFHFYSTTESTCAYRLAAEHRIELFSPRNAAAGDSTFYANYPPDFPILSLRLEDCGHEPDDVEQALAFAGIFGVAHLTSESRAEAIEIMRPVWEDCEELEDFEPGLDHFLDHWPQPLLQTHLGFQCLNPACGSRGNENRTVIAIISGDPITGCHLWMPDREVHSVQIEYHLCTNCHTLHANAASD